MRNENKIEIENVSHQVPQKKGLLGLQERSRSITLKNID